MGEVTFDILESCLDFDKGSMGEWLKECCTLGHQEQSLAKAMEAGNYEIYQENSKKFRV